MKTKVALLEGRLNAVTSDTKTVERNAMYAMDSNRGNEEISERLKQLDVERSLLYKEHEIRKSKEKEVSALEQLLKYSNKIKTSSSMRHFILRISNHFVVFLLL